MSTNPTAPPVSNAAAQEAVKLADLRGTMATLLRSSKWAVLDLHTYNAGQPSRPSLLAIRPGDPMLFVYVMGDKGTLSAKQREWVEYVEAAGGEVIVARPATIGDAFERFRETRPARLAALEVFARKVADLAAGLPGGTAGLTSAEEALERLVAEAVELELVEQ